MIIFAAAPLFTSAAIYTEQLSRFVPFRGT